MADTADGLPCMWPIGHRNARSHNCGCICDRDRGHKGKHLCQHDRRELFQAQGRPDPEGVTPT